MGGQVVRHHHLLSSAASSLLAVDVSQESEYLPFYVTLSSSDIVIVIYGSFHLIPEVLEVIL